MANSFRGILCLVFIHLTCSAKLEVTQVNEYHISSGNVLPSLPKALIKNQDNITLIDIWKFGLNQSDPQILALQRKIPKTVIVPSASAMRSVVPLEKAHLLRSLFAENYDIILDSTSELSIDLSYQKQDQKRMVKTLSGRDIVVMRPVWGELNTINGIEIESNKILEDGTVLVVIKGFLFNHEEIFQNIVNSKLKKIQPISSSTIRPIPAIPDSLEVNVYQHGMQQMLTIWKNLRSQEQYQQMLAPKTVIAVDKSVMDKLLPPRSEHLLYSAPNRIAEKFILDSTIAQYVNQFNKSMAHPNGMNMKTLSGKSITFLLDPRSGKRTVNGIEIKDFKQLSENVVLITINDFLFKHREDITFALNQLSKKCYTSPSVGSLPPVPDVPPTIIGEIPPDFLNVWQNYIINRRTAATSLTPPARRPKTIVVVSQSTMKSVLSTERAIELSGSVANIFLLDSISYESFDIKALRLTSDIGMYMSTLSDRKMHITRDHSGKLTINGNNEVISYQKLHDGTVILIVKDFLFDHYDLINSFILKLKQCFTIAQIIPGLKRPIPMIPAAVKLNSKEYGISQMVNIWEYIYNLHGPLHQLQSAPKTVIAVEQSIMENLVPPGSDQLLHSTSNRLAENLILDSTVTEFVSRFNENMSSPQGLTVRTLSGKVLTFRQDSLKGENYVNGIKIKEFRQLSDGTVLIIITDFLFGHKNEMELALKKGIPMKCSQLPDPPGLLPSVPHVPLAVFDLLPRTFLSIWKNYNKSNQPDSTQLNVHRIPKTIIAVAQDTMDTVISADIEKALKTGQNKAIAYNWILDSMSLKSLNIDDPCMTTTQGLTLFTMSGKKLRISKDSSGKLIINGIQALFYEKLYDGTIVLVVREFLFDHFDQIKSAILKSNESGQDSKERVSLKIKIPAIPAELNTNRNLYNVSQMIDIWDYMYNLQKPEYQTEPAPNTVIAVEKRVLEKLLPSGLEQLLYSTENSIAESLILDSTSAESISQASRSMDSSQGMTVKALSGKILVFKRNLLSGEYTVNGIKIREFRQLTDGTILITIEDFLFLHREKIQLLINEATTSMCHPSSEFNDVTPIPSISDAAYRMLPRTFHDMLQTSQEAKQLGTNRQSSVNSPGTIIVVDQSIIDSAMPRLSANALRFPLNDKIVKNIILESMLHEKINIIDMDSEVNMVTMSGKPIIFGKDSAGHITINGTTQVINTEKLEDGTVILLVDSFIFNHHSQMRSAMMQWIMCAAPPSPILTKPTVPFPNIPQELILDGRLYGVSQLVDMWSRLKEHYGSESTFLPAPKTVLAVANNKMESLLQPGYEKILYSKKNIPVTAKLILDSTVGEYVNHFDNRMLSATGMVFKAMSGKELRFRKDPNTSQYMVNDCKILRFRILKDKTVLVILKDFLHEHFEDIHNALTPILVEKCPELSYDPVLPPLPSIPYAVMEQVSSRFVEEWQHYLQSTSVTEIYPYPAPGPKVILIVDGKTFNSAVTPDTAKALRWPQNKEVLHNYIVDSMSSETLSVNDPQLVTHLGISLYTISGKKMQFKKDYRGILTVNGIQVIYKERLSDGTVVMVLTDFLFDHLERIEAAIQKWIKCGETSQIAIVPSITIPEIPQSLRSHSYQYRVSKMIQIWNELRHELKPVYSRPTPAPKTVIAVEKHVMEEALPEEYNKILFPESNPFIKYYILESISEEYVYPFDVNMKTPNGIVVKSLSGKNLIFKENPVSGIKTVNGIKIRDFQQLYDGTMLITIYDFLFEHKRGFESILNQRSVIVCPLDANTKQLPTIPYVPQSIIAKMPEKYLKFWQHLRSRISASDKPKETLLPPKTVFIVDPSNKKIVFNQETTKALYAKQNKFLTADLLMNNMSPEAIDIADPRLTSTAGIIAKTMTGKQLTFKKDIKGTFTVNSTEIMTYEKLPDGTIILLLSDYLPGFYEQVQKAVERFNHCPDLPALPPRYVPSIPRRLQANSQRYGVSSFIKIWSHLLAGSDVNVKAAVPNTIIAVHSKAMSGLLRSGSGQGPYSASTWQAATDFILDCSSEEYFDRYNHTMTSPSGMLMTSLSGKKLSVKKSGFLGKMTVNGVKVVEIISLDNGAIVIIIEDFMNDHRQMLQEVIAKPATVPEQLFLSSDISFAASTLFPSMPVPIPQEVPTYLVNIWREKQHSINKEVTKTVPSDVLRAIIVLEPTLIQSAFPRGVDGVLISKRVGSENLILDCVTLEGIDFNEEGISSKSGLIITTMSGKLLIIKKDITGEITINGIIVASHKILPSGIMMIIVKDFLFNHYELMTQAVKHTT